MRRRHAHMAFGAVTVVCAAIAAYQGWRLSEAQRVNDAITHANAAAATSEVPEARFARALDLARRGEYEKALQLYKVLARDERGTLATDALYNMGNLHFREAFKKSPDAVLRRLPLLELAKQSYRAVLRRDPQNWDARYNLERTLWLAPEAEDTTTLTIQRDAESRVMSTLQSTRGDLP